MAGDSPDASSKSLQSAADFDDTPAGQQQRWAIEVEAAKKALDEFWDEGDKVVKEFLGKGDGSGGYKNRRLNLFYSDTITKAANMSGDPKIRAKRRFADAQDDVARVSATMLERLLNMDLQRPTDGFRKALKNAKGDWIKVGLGQIRHRYVMDEEEQEGKPAVLDDEGKELAPEVPASTVKGREDVETDYVYWRDYLWSPCRVWDEVRWTAYKLLLTRDACVARWGDEVGKKIPLRNKDAKRKEDRDSEDPWARAEIWEIWDKEEREVHYYAEGMTELIATDPDPLQLEGFFPSPEPLMANLATTDLVPRATYWLAKDLYDEAHELTRRIRGLVKACKVAGVYDSASPDLQRLMSEACENELIPTVNWSVLSDKGGIQGAISWLPVEQFVKVLAELVQQRNLVKVELNEITGQSDIMRGQAAQSATATEQRIKARFGAGRIRSEQEELARFASESQRIRGEIISRHCDAETIVKRSNIEAAETMPAPVPPQPPPMPGMPPPPVQAPKMVPNAPLIQEAVALLKSDISGYRIDVDSDSLGITDFDAIQQEGVSIMQATADFFSKAAPLMTNPTVGAFFLELYQASISQFRGAERYEAIIDRAVAQLKSAAMQPPKPPPPDPKVQAATVKAQAEGQKAQIGLMQTKVDAQAHVQKTGLDLQAKQAEFGMRMAELRAKQATAMDVMPVDQGGF